MAWEQRTALSPLTTCSLGYVKLNFIKINILTSYPCLRRTCYSSEFSLKQKYHSWLVWQKPHGVVLNTTSENSSAPIFHCLTGFIYLIQKGLGNVQHISVLQSCLWRSWQLGRLSHWCTSLTIQPNNGISSIKPLVFFLGPPPYIARMPDKEIGLQFTIL